MIRPRSITLFERLFLASLLSWCIVQAMTWADRVALLAQNPIIADPTSVIGLVEIAVAALTVAVWYFVARRASVVARWVAIGFGVCSALAFVFGVVALVRAPSTWLVSALSLVTSALSVAAAAMLMRRDVRPWFGTDDTGGEFDR